MIFEKHTAARPAEKQKEPEADQRGLTSRFELFKRMLKLVFSQLCSFFWVVIFM